MNVKVSDGELELMAGGLHPRDIVWLEKRVETLEAALGEIYTDTRESGWCDCDVIARAALSEGDASD